MASREGPTLAASVKRRGLTRDDIEDLITSKVERILPANFQKIGKTIKDRRNNAIKHISIRITSNGDIDRRVSSSSAYQLAEIVPARQGQNVPSPIKLSTVDSTWFNAGNYKENLSDEKKKLQKMLFNILFVNNLLSDNLSCENGHLRNMNRILTAAELCHELDRIAQHIHFEIRKMFAPDTPVTARMRDDGTWKNLLSCSLRVTMHRICMMMFYPDDILSRGGHNDLDKHAQLIASFATLTIALDSLFDVTQIPDCLNN